MPFRIRAAAYLALGASALIGCGTSTADDASTTDSPDASPEAAAPAPEGGPPDEAEPDTRVPSAAGGTGSTGGSPALEPEGDPTAEGPAVPNPDAAVPVDPVPEPAPTAPPDPTMPTPAEPDPGGSGGADPGAVPECNPNDSLECPCPEGQLRCYGVCTDPLTNADHCGATDGCESTATPGVACKPANAVCEAGQCNPCTGSLVACANRCLDPVSDPTYCGAAPGCSVDAGSRGDRCATPELCLDSVCVECFSFDSRVAGLPEHGEQLAFGDVNSDGEPDVVTVTGEGGELLVISSAMDLEIGEQLAQPFGEDLTALGMGRLDADDTLDVVVGDAATGLVMIGLGNGDGSFETGQSYTVEGIPRQVLLALVDDDQTLDAFVVTTDSPGPTLLLGKGDGTFIPGPAIAWPDRLYAVDVGDLNADGALDAVFVGLQESALVLLGDGTGAFQALTYETDGYSYALKLAELNGDGMLDLVTGGSAAYNVSVALGNGDGTFQPGDRTDTSESLQSYDAIVNAIDVADFNGDAQLDVVVAMNKGTSVMWGRENWATDVTSTVNGSGEVTHMITGDYNRDGVVDVINNLFNTNSDFRIDFGAIPPECPTTAP